MKNNMIRTSLWALLVGAFSTLSLVSCDKDEDTAPQTIQSQIVGTWDFTSFTVGGDEYMGTVVDSAYVRFEAFTGDQGNFQQRIRYIDGEIENIAGKYKVNETTKIITMVADGDTIVVLTSFPAAKKMQWIGDDEGQPVELKAQRR